MRRVLLSIAAVLLIAATGALSWLLLSEAALQWIYPRLFAAAPGALTADAVRGRLAGPISIEALHWRHAGQDLRVAHLELDWSPTSLLVLGLHIDRLDARDIALQIGPVPAPAAGPLELTMPMRLSVDSARLERATVAIGDASPSAFGKIELGGSWGGDRLRIERLAVSTAVAELAVQGWFGTAPPYATDGRFSWRWSERGTPVLEGRGRLEGHLGRLALTHELLAPFPLTVQATIHDVAGPGPWRVEGRLDQQLQGKPALHGDWRATGDRERWRVDPLRLVVAGTDATLQAQAEGGMSGEAPLQATVIWQALRWPLRGAPRYASPQGQLRLNGTVADVRVELNSRLRLAALPELRVTAQARADRNRLRVTRLTATGTPGALTASGMIRWQPDLAWSLRYDARHINPAVAWPDWPGDLAARGSASGTGRGSATIVIDALHGPLRGVPLSLATTVAVDGERLHVPRFDLRAPGTTLTLSGERSQHWQVDWRLQVDELARLWPGAGGTLASHGQLRGPRLRPRVEAELTGHSLAIDGYRVGQIDARGHIDLDDREDLSLDLQARDLAISGHRLSSVALQAGGRMATHQFAGTATAAGGRLELAGAGSHGATGWSGRLTRLDLDHAATGRWQLDADLPWRLARTQIEIGRSCWRSEAARLCGHGAWRRDHDLRFDLEAIAVPLVLLDGWLPAATQLTGALDARLQARIAADGDLDGALNARLSPGRIRYRSARGSVESMNHDGATLHLQAGDGRLGGELRLDIPANGWLVADGTVPFQPFTPRPATDAAVDVHLRAEIPDLQPLTPDLPELERLAGRLSADLRIGGTRVAPRVRGELHLRDGAAHITRLGIKLTGIEIRAASDDGRRVDIALAAKSGDGQLRSDGQWVLGSSGTWNGQMRISGDRFELIKTHEAWLLVSPEISLQFEPGTLRLDGVLRVPRGRITPRDLTQARRESADTVRVDGAAASATAPPLAVTADLQLVLEEKVWFEGFGFSGWIAGDVHLREEPRRPTTGRGEVRVVSGHYTVYGRRLEVDRGRLLFALGPIANPALDVRAVRRLPEVLVGVQASGTLRSPRLTLFSEPALDQTDILAYLLLGRPASQAGQAEGGQLYQAAASLGLVGGEMLARSIGERFGIEEVRIESGSTGDDTSLVLGTYLTPQLYISYGIGLLEPINTVRLRYQFDQRWQVEAHSGAAQGADLFYTIRR